MNNVERLGGFFLNIPPALKSCEEVARLSDHQIQVDVNRTDVG